MKKKAAWCIAACVVVLICKASMCNAMCNEAIFLTFSPFFDVFLQDVKKPANWLHRPIYRLSLVRVARVELTAS